MKLFTTLSAAAVVSAQGFGNDFNDLNQLFASLTADLNAGAAPNVGNSAPVSAPVS